jgi:23S rRNA (uridine2479-2'-O)-methyltransferase
MKPKLVKIYTENNNFQFLETLRRNRTKRNRAGEFFVEGVRAINQARTYGWDIRSYGFARDQRLSDWAANILATSTAQFHYEMARSLLDKISQKENTSELIATIAIPPDDLNRIPTRSTPLVVVLDRILSPGNLGTIIRSGDALGADGFILTGHAVDLYAPETIRATTGSFFALPVVRLPSHKTLLLWIETWRQKYPQLQIVGTSSKSDIVLNVHNFSQPTILLIGNENHGLGQNYQTLADVMVTIPMSGSATSMNVACATSILLYEIAKQRS